jgi:hypothetical protein
MMGSIALPMDNIFPRSGTLHDEGSRLLGHICIGEYIAAAKRLKDFRWDWILPWITKKKFRAPSLHPDD